MDQHEQELRDALAARSGGPDPAFRERLAASLAASSGSRPPIPALALAAMALLVVAGVGGLVLSRHLLGSAPVGRRHLVVAASPSPSPSLEASPSPAPAPSFMPPTYPTTVDVTAGSGALWAYLRESGSLYRSTDGGATWQLRPTPANLALPPSTSFISAQEGWLLSTGSPGTQCLPEIVTVLDHTLDAGLTWSAIHPTGIGDRQCKHDLSFVDSSHGFLITSDPNSPPVIYRTLNGGHTWAASRPLADPPGFQSGPGGFELNAGRVRAFGSTLLVNASGQSRDGTFRSYVFRSEDGGATWSYLAKVPQGGEAAFASATRWLSFMPSLLETTDAGASWHAFTSDYADAAPVAPYVFFDGSTAYAVITTRGSIHRSLDGGVHWSLEKLPGT